MPWWGHEGGEDTGSNMATSGHSEQSKRWTELITIGSLCQISIEFLRRSIRRKSLYLSHSTVNQLFSQWLQCS
jgi:hypothetical protein